MERQQPVEDDGPNNWERRDALGELADRFREAMRRRPLPHTWIELSWNGWEVLPGRFIVYEKSGWSNIPIHKFPDPVDVEQAMADLAGNAWR